MKQAILLCIIICNLLGLHSIQSTPITVGIPNNFEPFIMKQGHMYTGFSIELFREIADEIGLDYAFQDFDTTQAVIDAVSDQTVDLGFGGIPVELKLERRLDYSIPYFESGFQVVIPEPKKELINFELFENIASSIVSTGFLKGVSVLLILMFIASNIVWFSERKHNSAMFPDNYFLGIWESFWWSAVTLTTVGYGDKTPSGFFGRSVALLWMFSGIFLVSFFTANVTSSMTINKVNKQVFSVQDLRGKQVGTVKGSPSEKVLRKVGARVFEFNTIDRTCEAVRRKLLVAAVYDAPSLRYIINIQNQKLEDEPDKARLQLVGEIFNKHFFAFCFPENSPEELKEDVNRALLRLVENGRYNEIYQRWFGTSELSFEL